MFLKCLRTSSRDTTEDRPPETLDAALPVDVPKATRAQLPHLSYSSWPGIQGRILPLLPVHTEHLIQLRNRGLGLKALKCFCYSCHMVFMSLCNPHTCVYLVT